MKKGTELGFVGGSFGKRAVRRSGGPGPRRSVHHPRAAPDVVSERIQQRIPDRAVARFVAHLVRASARGARDSAGWPSASAGGGFGSGSAIRAAGGRAIRSWST